MAKKAGKKVRSKTNKKQKINKKKKEQKNRDKRKKIYLKVGKLVVEYTGGGSWKNFDLKKFERWIKQRNLDFKQVDEIPTIVCLNKDTPMQNMNISTDATLNNFGLTRQEKRIASLLINGATYKNIADQLVLSLNTIKYHIRKIYTKTGVKTRQELQNLAYKNMGYKRN